MPGTPRGRCPSAVLAAECAGAEPQPEADEQGRDQVAPQCGRAHDVAGELRSDAIDDVLERVDVGQPVEPPGRGPRGDRQPVSYTHLRAHETRHDLVCRLLLEKKKTNYTIQKQKKNK